MQDTELLPDQPLGEKLIRKGFWLYLFAYLIAPAWYLIRMIISNSISVEEVGVLYSIVGLISLLNVYNDLWLSESLLYFLPRYWIKKQYDYAKTAIVLWLGAQMITAFLIALLLWFGAPRLSAHYFHHPSAALILKYFCLYFLGINLFQTLQIIFSAFQDVVSQQLTEFIRTWAIVGFTFFFFITGQASIAHYSLNRVLGLAVGIIVALIIFWRKYPYLISKGKIVRDKVMLREYMRYAIWVFIGANVGTLLGNLGQQLIILILGAKMAWYYANYLSMLYMSNVLLGPILGLVFPLVSELITKWQKDRLWTLQNFFYTYFLLSSLMLSGLFTALGTEIAIVLFGTKFAFSGTLFVYSAWLMVFMNFIGFNFSVLAWLGKIKERVKIIAITAGVTLMVDLILLYLIGIWWALAGLAIGLGVMFWLSYRLIHKHEPIHVQWKIILKNIPIIIVLCVILWYVKGGFFVMDDLARYRNLGVLVVFGFAYLGVLGALNRRQVGLLVKEVKNLLQNQKKWI